MAWTDSKKLKASHTRYLALSPEMIPVSRQSACRWRDYKSSTGHYFPSGLQLPSKPQSITAYWLVPSYTAWWRRHL